MWYEVLPSVGVIFVAMSLGGLAQGWIPNLILGKPTHRQILDNHEKFAWMRDVRLTGHAYKMQGLEAIPDAGSTEDKK